MHGTPREARAARHAGAAAGPLDRRPADESPNAGGAVPAREARADLIQGLDVGIDQGTITAQAWQRIRAEAKRFAFLRCSEGLGSLDPTFPSNVAGAKAAGLAVGPYFVLHAWLDAEAQAEAWFASSKGLGMHAGELAPAIDVELDMVDGRTMAPANVLASTVATIRSVAIRWRRPPVVYTYRYFLGDVLTKGGDATPLAEEAVLWLAAYGLSPPAPPPPWTTVTWWQSGGGPTYRVPSGAPCDADYFLGAEADFAAACDPTARVIAPRSPDE